MEKSTGRTIRLGIMVITGTILFTVAVYLIGQKQDMFSKTFQLRVVFNNVSGLKPGNNVRFSGINVGSVMAVTIQNDSTIEVTMRIREEVHQFIKTDALATIGTDGLMGNMIININPGRGQASVVEDNSVLKSYSRVKTDDILKTLNMTNENAAILTSSLLDVVENIQNGEGTLSYLIYDTLLRANLFQSVNNLQHATDKTNQLLLSSNDIEGGKGLLGYLLRDTITSNRILATMKERQRASTNIQLSTDSLKLFIQRLNNQEGTLHTLLSDSIMAKNLRETIANLNKGTAKFDENMEAMKSSFLTRKYFKDQEKEKAKEEKKKRK
jgi:phospholipid/cholesterol/gamma-HCH transport system substrate-binding protein